jgi:hypothetical protein
MVGSTWQNQAAYLMVAKGQKQRKREAGSQYLLQGHNPNELYSSYRLYLLKNWPPYSSVTADEKPSTHHLYKIDM